MQKKALLMYISENSGHHRACLAIENALRGLNKDIHVKCINSFHYTNPVLEKIINKTYMAVIKTKPEVWDYLYDNPTVMRKTRRLKEAIHRFNSGKMRSLIDIYKPNAILCTQAFPCGIIADMKKSCGIKIPLFAALTDYAPHSYWVYNDVDTYFVPSEETGRKLVHNGVSADKIRPTGIPIDPKFYMESDRDKILKNYSLSGHKPIILLMGGGQGLGPIKKLAIMLDKSPLDIQIVVVTGVNKKLHNFLKNQEKHFTKTMRALSFSEDIDKLMEISTIIMTKPGGLTTAEAISKNLPMVIVNPLPGQEAMNTRFLLENNLAVRAKDFGEAVVLLEELLINPEKLKNIKIALSKNAKPDASLKIAKLVLEMSR